jgi:hypothetical protein
VNVASKPRIFVMMATKRRDEEVTKPRPPAVPRPAVPLAPGRGQTLRMLDDEKTRIDPPRPMPGIEVEYVLHEGPRGTAPDETVIEVWTARSLYKLDRGFRCIGVVDRDTGKEDPKSRVKGALLAGGERRRGESYDFFLPLPVPGTQAVFSDPRNARVPVARTSSVERVVLRLRKVVLSPHGSDSIWEELTGRFQAPT